MGTVHVLWSSTDTPPASEQEAAQNRVHFNQPGGFSYMQQTGRSDPMPAANTEISVRMHKLCHLVNDALKTPRKRAHLNEDSVAEIESEMAEILSRLRTR